jgi:hypothetical protein
VTAKPEHHQRANRFKQRHRRAVNRPYPHHDECGATQLIAYPVKPRVLFVLAYETLDLPDARQIIVQQGVHV